MKRIALFVLLALLPAAPSSASSYYFSDCPGPGGDGSIGNPWCVIPTGETLQKSAGVLFDGAGTEAAPGDVILFCAGVCDGTGTGIIHAATVTTGNGSNKCNQPTGKAWLSPRASGSPGQPIVLQPYCNGTACETVSISMDTNGNGVTDSGEPTSVLTNMGNGSTVHGIPLSYFEIHGDPAHTGVRHLTIRDMNDGTPFMFDCSDDGGGDADHADGVSNIVIDGVLFSGWRDALWPGTVDVGVPSGCGFNAGAGYFFKINNAGGPVTIGSRTNAATPNRFENGCGMLTRWNNNYSASAVLALDYNEIENWSIVSNDHTFLQDSEELSHTGTDSHIEYIGNKVTDVAGGFSIENHARHETISGNTISCSGRRITSAATNGKYWCTATISVTSGDTPNSDHSCVGGSKNGVTCPNGGCPGGTCTGPSVNTSDDIHITGNVIVGNPMNSRGYLWFGPEILTSHYSGTFPTGIFVGDNVVMNQEGPWTGDSGGFPLHVSSPSLGVHVWNNTIYRSANRVLLDGTAVDFVNNLIDLPGKSTSSSVAAAEFATSAIASTIANNSFHGSSTAPGAVKIGATNYRCDNSFCTGLHLPATCCTDVGQGTCDVPSTLPTNRCTGGHYVDVGSVVPARWNVHLRYPNVGIIDAGSALGSQADIDGQARPLKGGYDIGADECPFDALSIDSQPQPGPTAPVTIDGRAGLP